MKERHCDECNGKMKREEYDEYVEFICEDCGNYIRLFYDDNDNLIDEY